MARKRNFVLLSAAVAAVAVSVGVIQVAVAHGLHDRFQGRHHHHGARRHDREGRTATPIKHVVVIFQENVSFDHYFGTYPSAANTDGQTFHARRHTPAVDGLLPATSPSLPPALQHTTNLLTSNPNESLPQRLDSSATGASTSPGGQLTCDQDHDYSDEQAFDGGNMDHFVQSVGTGSGTSPFGTPCDANVVMDYYDGNTVTAMWNYAQHFSMSATPSTRSALRWEARGSGATRTTTSPTTSRCSTTPPRPTRTT
jgi:phospholipase C